MKSLFDENGVLNVSDIVTDSASFKTIMADGIVTDDELDAQTHRAIDALRHLQDICTPEQQSAMLDAITELSVLFASYHIHELQDLRR